MATLLCFLLAAAFAGEPYSAEVPGTTGMDLCCRPGFWTCYDGCPRVGKVPKGDCVSRCETAHCVAKTRSCEAPVAPTEAPAKAGPPVPPPPSPPSAKGDLRYDGQLTGPGTVSFEVSNFDGETRALVVHGLVFGTSGGMPRILRRTGDFTVMPGQTSRFQLAVSPDDFSGWSKAFGRLTLAFGFANERERDRWQYKNLLTQKDVESARTGEFTVKGAFEPLGRP